jgi:uncharacterized coiled-coil protein SlyX/Arc/MetJ-type ribon-helix-helix transcriptional regulator
MSVEINDWVEENCPEQYEFLLKAIKNSCANIPNMSGFTRDAHVVDIRDLVVKALEQLNRTGRVDLIKKIKGGWSTKKHDLKEKKNSVMHTIKLSKDASAELKKLTIEGNFKSKHETVEALVQEQYQQITYKINLEKKQKKEELLLKRKAKEDSFFKSEQSKKISSHYVSVLQYQKLRNELKEANQLIANLDEKLTSKEGCIDKHLDKISRFVDKLDDLEKSNLSSKVNLNGNIPTKAPSPAIEDKQEQEGSWNALRPRKKK